LVKITWFGHSAFRIEMAGATILVDPFLNENPVSPVKASEITEADVVYVTHDHGDHLGDSFSICKRTNATLVAAVELADQARKNRVEKTAGLNIGGSIELAGVKLNVVQATHTSSVGSATGVVIEGDGRTVYHAGDTGLFGDMKLIGELYKLDVALIPIGGYYTMGAKEACAAVGFLNPKVAIPMHYGTFPVLARSADEFVKFVKEKTPGVKVVVLRPGESYEL
jgi:L-ascorbate metabolism protein UlaG (beta-lactamase superfamily)